MKKLSWNLTYLKYFFDAVQLGSISLSARKNFVSQSAISQAIFKLEKDLGCQLMIHQPNRFQATEEGKKLFTSAKEIFQSIRKAEETFAEESVSTIEFACTHSFALTFLPNFLKKTKNLQVHIRLGQADTIMEWIRKGVVDFGILLDNIDLSSFYTEEIYQGEFGLYQAKGSKQNSFLVDSEERTETNLLKKEYKKLFNKELPVGMRVSSWAMIAKLSEEGLGIGFFPDYVVKNRTTKLKKYPKKIVTIPYKIYALFSHPHVKSHAIESFLQILKSTK